MKPNAWKWLAIAVGVLFLFEAGFCLVFNLYLSKNCVALASAASHALKRPVGVQRIYYNPWAGIVFEHIRIGTGEAGSSPASVEKARLIPSFEFKPAPAMHIKTIILEKPIFTLQGQTKELFHMGMTLKNPHINLGKVLGIKFYIGLASFEFRHGKASLLSSSANQHWQQNFENVSFFAGNRWFLRNLVSLKGHIAGKPQAKFDIAWQIQENLPKKLDSNVRLNFNNFTTEYLNRHLDPALQVPGDELTAALHLKIRSGDRIQAEGEVKLPKIWQHEFFTDRFWKKYSKLRFSVRGSWKNGQGKFSEVLVKSANIQMKGKAELSVSEALGFYRLSLASGAVPIENFETLVQPLTFRSGNVRFYTNIEGSAQRFEPSLSIAFDNCSLSDAKKKFILDRLGGQIYLSKNDATAREIWCFVNNVPVRVNGQFQFSPASLKISASTYPGQLPSLKPKNPVNAAFDAEAAELANGWTGFARFEMEDYKSGKKRMQAQSASFEGLLREPKQGPWNCRSLAWQKEDSSGKADLQIFLRKMQFIFLLNEHEMRLEILNAVLKAVLQANEISYPVTAQFSAKVFCKKTPPSADIEFKLVNGQIGPNEKMAELAQQTGIAALDVIRFPSFTGQAFYRSEQWELKNFQMNGDSLGFKAKAKIKNAKIEGALSLEIRASSIHNTGLHILLWMIGNQEWLDFDFAFKGALASPKVRWVGGDFKQKIERRLPQWLIHRLTQQIESSLANFKAV